MSGLQSPISPNIPSYMFIFWYSLWNITWPFIYPAYILAIYLTFCLTYVLTFCRKFCLVKNRTLYLTFFPGKHSEILSGMTSDILSYRLCGIHSHIISEMHSDIYSILTFYVEYSLTFYMVASLVYDDCVYLTFLLTAILNFCGWFPAEFQARYRVRILGLRVQPDRDLAMMFGKWR